MGALYFQSIPIGNINYLVNQYNNSYHQTIKMRPIDVCTTNQEIILKSVYNIPKIFPKHTYSKVILLD